MYVLYYKNCLPLKVLDIRFLHKSTAFDLRIGNKLCSFISFYRSPNQSYDDFESFLDNFELTLDTLTQNKPFLMVALGDFNAKSSNWYNKDITRLHVLFFNGLQFQNVLLRSYFLDLDF